MKDMTIITHKDMETYLSMQKASKEDVSLMMGILDGLCKQGNGIFRIEYKDKVYDINLNTLDKTRHFQILYSHICRIWKNKPLKKFE